MTGDTLRHGRPTGPALRKSFNELLNLYDAKHRAGQGGDAERPTRTAEKQLAREQLTTLAEYERFFVPLGADLADQALAVHHIVTDPELRSAGHLIEGRLRELAPAKHAVIAAAHLRYYRRRLADMQSIN